MDHKDWDTYIIPPNFIEGGTLLGGMFKVRNVIEAVILAAIVAVPILQLSVSLTARIIMLPSRIGARPTSQTRSSISPPSSWPWQTTMRRI